MKILHEVLEIYVYQTCRRDVTEEVLQNFKSSKQSMFEPSSTAPGFSTRRDYVG